MLWVEPTLTPKVPNTPPPLPTSQGPSPHSQVLRIRSFLQLLPAGRWLLRDGGLGQLAGTKPTINLHKKQKRTPSPFFQPQPKKDAGVTKLTRSQKTEVIQAQCANRVTRTHKTSNTRPKRFQQLLFFLWPGRMGVGAVSQAFCALRTWVSHCAHQVWGVEKVPRMIQQHPLGQYPDSQQVSPPPGQGTPGGDIHGLPLDSSSLMGSFSQGLKEGWQGTLSGCWGTHVFVCI